MPDRVGVCPGWTALWRSLAETAGGRRSPPFSLPPSLPPKMACATTCRNTAETSQELTETEGPAQGVPAGL